MSGKVNAQSGFVARYHIYLFGLLIVVNTEALAELQFDGQNTLTIENYRVTGDTAQGLYQYEGLQWFDDLSLNFSNQFSAYRGMHGYMLVDTNRSDYRGEQDSQINNASVNYENGEAALPYRLSAGDYFASQSRHTLQLGLKGVQVELQPRTAASPHSFQLFTGRTAQDYNTFFEDDDHYYLGASWLTETSGWGDFAVTTVNYHSSVDVTDHDENVSSFAWEKEFSVGRFTHIFETELAYLSGDNAQSDSLEGLSQYLAFSGYNTVGSNYRVNLERNDEQFNPAGAAATPDRETIDLQWGQRLFTGLNGRVRSQRYQDAISTDNVSTSRVNGINLSGTPFTAVSGLFSRLNLGLDFYRQQDEDEALTLDRESDVLQLNFNLPLSANLRNRVSYQRTSADDLIAQTTTKRESAAVGIDMNFQTVSWNGVFSPTLSYVEDIDVNNNQTENLTLGWLLSAEIRGHRLLFSHQQVDFRADDPVAIESTTMQTRLEWRKDWKRHGLMLSLDHYNRDPENATDVDSYKMAIAWVYRFDQDSFVSQPISTGDVDSFTEFRYLTDLTLGARFDTRAREVLNTAHFTHAGNSGAYQLFEGRLFDDIGNRQVMAVKAGSGYVESVNLLMPISSDPHQAQDTYRKVLDKLLNIYGSPERDVERGQFSANWLTQLDNNAFSRIVEWRTEKGVLRFGIPRPVSGQLRLELQLKRGHRPADSNDWGLSVVM